MFAKVILLIADVWAIVCVLRMLLQRGGLSPQHPAMKFCKQFTDVLIAPFNRLKLPTGRLRGLLFSVPHPDIYGAAVCRCGKSHFWRQPVQRYQPQ